MLVMLLERVTPSLRGELTRWLLEPKAGVFVGDVSAMVRDRLWHKCCKQAGRGGVTQIWSTNTEQGFDMRSDGRTGRTIRDFDGLRLIQTPHATEGGKADEVSA